MEHTHEAPDGLERVDEFLIKLLKERIPYADGDIPDVARDIRQLARSDNALNQYFRRHNNDGGTSSRIDKGILRAKTNGKPRVARPVRVRLEAPRSTPANCYSSEVETLNHTKAGHNAGLHTTGDCLRTSVTAHPPRAPSVDEGWLGTRIPNGAARKYRCIFDDKSFATKGNCRKHLEEQHVLKKMQQCDRCSLLLETVPKAEIHCKSCPQWVLDGPFPRFRQVTTEKQVYGSPFTGECFTSSREYVSHLLDLSERTQKAKKPYYDHLHSFRGLLRQPSIRAELQSISQSLLGSQDVLSDLEWDEECIHAFAPVLEHGVVDIEPGHPHALRRHMVQSFLERVLKASSSIIKYRQRHDTYLEPDFGISDVAGIQHAPFASMSNYSMSQWTMPQQHIPHLQELHNVPDNRDNENSNDPDIQQIPPHRSWNPGIAAGMPVHGLCDVPCAHGSSSLSLPAETSAGYLHNECLPIHPTFDQASRLDGCDYEFNLPFV